MLDRNYEKAVVRTVDLGLDHALTVLIHFYIDKMWLEKTEKLFPYAKQVTELKEKIWASEKTNSELIDWENYLKNAIVRAHGG
jgi:hypothetical protein